MKLYILNETFELGNTEESIEQVFEYIRQAIEETEYNFSYMIVDGEEVDDEFEIYREDNLNSIKEVKIVMMTNKEIVEVSLCNINNFLKSVIPVMKTLSDNFYKEPSAEDWELASNLVEEVRYIIYIRESMDDTGSLSALISNYYAWNDYKTQVSTLNNITEEFRLALEQVDTDKIGDMIASEIIPAFEKMNIQLDVLLEK